MVTAQQLSEMCDLAAVQAHGSCRRNANQAGQRSSRRHFKNKKYLEKIELDGFQNF